MFSETCGLRCEPYQSSMFTFSYPGSGRTLMFLTIHGIMYFGLIFIIESNMAHRLLHKIFSKDNKDERKANRVTIQRSGFRVIY